MCCLQKAFAATNLSELVAKIMSAQYIPLPSSYSEGLKSLISQLLKVEPNQRPSASEVLQYWIPLVFRNLGKNKGYEFKSSDQLSESYRSVLSAETSVYIQDILHECLVPEPPTGPVTPWRKKSVETFKHGPSNMHWKSVILLVPLRLGAEKLNPIYGNSLKTLLSTEYCIGIIGGRPKHSLYFVGFQEDKLIHLDPHYCQEMVDVNQENFPVNSFHCKSPRKLKLSKLDPCCCIGFYCQTKSDFDNFVASVQPYLLPIRQSPQGSSNSSPEPNYPLFVFSRSRSSEYQVDEVAESVYKPMQQQLRNMMNQHDATETWSDDDDETDEFVII